MGNKVFLWQSQDAYLPRGQVLAGYNGNLPPFYNDLFCYAVPIPSLAPGSPPALVNLLFDDDSTFELIYLNAALLDAGAAAYDNGSQSAYFSVQMIDGPSGHNYFNIPLCLAGIAGYGLFPHILPVPVRYSPASNVQFLVQNLDTAITAAGFIILMGKKIYSQQRDMSLMQSGVVGRFRNWIGLDQRQYYEQWGAYGLFLPTIASGQTISTTVLIDRSSDFEWVNSQGAAPPRNTTTGNVGAITNENLAVQIQDGTSNMRLFSSPLAFSTFVGTGAQPLVLPQSRVFEAASTLKVAITNNDTVAINNLNYILEGRKVYRSGT